MVAHTLITCFEHDKRVFFEGQARRLISLYRGAVGTPAMLPGAGLREVRTLEQHLEEGLVTGEEVCLKLLDVMVRYGSTGL